MATKRLSLYGADPLEALRIALKTPLPKEEARKKAKRPSKRAKPKKA